MSKGQVLVIDWKNKKLLTNQHNNSDDSFYQNKQKKTQYLRGHFKGTAKDWREV
jgi:hypothetical protein